ncbi:MAG: hypothetical protein R2806_16490 [Saprospiraceae bacterium]
MVDGRLFRSWLPGQRHHLSFPLPGQAYADGMQFVQFYFGMPIAMVILCITFIPIYYRKSIPPTNTWRPALTLKPD